VKKKNKKTVKGWADVGSHGGIFQFESGPVGDKYPTLMAIYSRQLSEELVPVTITYEICD
jgi:hypothetical protein